MKIKVENIVKVLDIDYQELLPATTEYLENRHQYEDRDDLQEHIYDIDNLLDWPPPFDPAVMAQMEEMREVCQSNDTCYFRLIKD